MLRLILRASGDLEKAHAAGDVVRMMRILTWCGLTLVWRGAGGVIVRGRGWNTRWVPLGRPK